MPQAFYCLVMPSQPPYHTLYLPYHPTKMTPNSIIYLLFSYKRLTREKAQHSPYEVVAEIFLSSLMSPEDLAELFFPWCFLQVCALLSLSLFFLDFASKHFQLPKEWR
jgi:hypothetical protein